MKSSGLAYRHPASRRHREGGFALLLVFLMAAIIGITLFMELPRIAFEVQRQKEQLLMERGEQYQIAIRRYMQRGLKQGVNSGPPATWPGKVEDLENTNGRRFLRKRYIDPMTGKDEWRIIHINNGILTDSLNNKQQGQGQATQWTGGQGITEFKGLGDATTGPSLQGAAAASRRRASDSNPMSGPGNGPPMDPSASPAGPPGTGQGPQPGIPGQLGQSGGSASGGPSMPFPGQSGQPGQQFGVLPVQQGNPGAVSSGSGISGGGGISSFGGGTTTSSSTAPVSGQAFGQLPPGVPGAPASSIYGGSPYSTVQGANGTAPPGFPQPGVGAGQPPASVSTLLNNMLTTPRPGGMPQVTPTGAAGGTAMGGGIAGVASKLDADSIMVCGDHSNYQEWEFIFDPSKWRAPNNPNTKLGGTPAGTNGAPGSGGPAGQPIGQPIGTQIGGPIGGAAGMAQPGGNMGNFGQGRTNGQGGQNGMGAMGQSNISNICGMGTTRPGAQ